MTNLFLAVAFTVASADESGQAALAKAAIAKGLAKTELGRAFVAEAAETPAFKTRTLYRQKQPRKLLTAAEHAKLDAAGQAACEKFEVNEEMYHGWRYGSPLAYLPALEAWAANGGPGADLRGKKIVDFGHGGIGQLRLLAALGAEVVGLDVDPAIAKLYSEPGDQGPVGKRGGSVRLVSGKFPTDHAVVKQIGTGFDLFLSKNTLKNGYVHPEQKVDPRMLLDLGVDDPTLLAAIRRALKPGGMIVIFNVCGARTPPGPKYSPMTDGRCPFASADLEKAGFETLLRDRCDDEAIRAFGRVAGWDRPPAGMDLEKDLFGLTTVLRKR